MRVGLGFWIRVSFVNRRYADKPSASEHHAYFTMYNLLALHVRACFKENSSLHISSEKAEVYANFRRLFSKGDPIIIHGKAAPGTIESWPVIG